MLFLIILLVYPARGVKAQEIEVEELIVERTVSCREIAYTTSVLLQEFYEKQQHDTLHALMHHWESHCGMQEPMMRFLTLHMIATNTFYEEWYPENILQLLDDYRQAQSQADFQNYYYDYSGWEYYPVNPAFNAFTRQLAEELKRYEDLSPTERFFLEYYSNNFKEARDMQAEGLLAGSRLDSLYQEVAKRSRRFISFSGGMWKPTGNMAVLGTRPEIGFAYAYQTSRVMFNTYFNIAFGNTRKDYQVVADQQLYNTRTFVGIALGLDFGLEVAKGKTTSLFIMPGLAYRGFESLNPDPETSDLPPRFIGSLSPNLALYLRNATPKGHFGIQARYNLVNFKNTGGTDLSGNVFTLGLVFGFNE